MSDEITQAMTSRTVCARSGEARLDREGPLLQVPIVLERIPIPNSGIWALSATELRSHRDLSEGQSVVLTPPYGSLGILALVERCLFEDELPPSCFVVLGELVVFSVGLHRPGLINIEPIAQQSFHELQLEYLLLSMVVDELCDRRAGSQGADVLRSLAAQLRDSELAAVAVDRVAELVLTTKLRRYNYLVTRRIEARIAFLIRVISSFNEAEDREEEIAPSLTLSPNEEQSPPTDRGGSDADDPGLRWPDDSRHEEEEFQASVREALPAAQAERVMNVARSLKTEETLASERRLRALQSLPWTQPQRKPLDIGRVSQALDASHFGNRHVKSQLLDVVIREEFARSRKRFAGRSGILFVGPPGVGKTSLAQSYAAAVDRPFVQISCSSIADHVALVGSPHQYSDSSPGRVVSAFIEAGVPDPIILLDEIDRMGNASGASSIAPTLLSLLDDSDNGCFVDSFLGVPFDTSRATFLATSNGLDEIPEALLDRFTIISVGGYAMWEREAVCREQLIPKLQARLGIRPEELQVTKDGVEFLVRVGGDDPSLRSVQRRIEIVLTEVIRRISNGRLPVVVDHEFVHTALRL